MLSEVQTPAIDTRTLTRGGELRLLQDKNAPEHEAFAVQYEDTATEFNFPPQLSGIRGVTREVAEALFANIEEGDRFNVIRDKFERASAELRSAQSVEELPADTLMAAVHGGGDVPIGRRDAPNFIITGLGETD